MSRRYDGAAVDLSVRLDAPATASSEEGHAAALAVARAFRWPRGRYDVAARRANAGATANRFEAWSSADACAVGAFFEDDVTVSPLWFRWLRAAR